jgi:hypothetical protein
VRRQGQGDTVIAAVDVRVVPDPLGQASHGHDEGQGGGERAEAEERRRKIRSATHGGVPHPAAARREPGPAGERSPAPTRGQGRARPPSPQTQVPAERRPGRVCPNHPQGRWRPTEEEARTRWPPGAPRDEPPMPDQPQRQGGTNAGAIARGYRTQQRGDGI